MDIYWYGQSFFKIKGKFAVLCIDPFDPQFTGLKLPKDLSCDVALSTHDHKDHNNTAVLQNNPIIISGPGEYEVKGVSVAGIQTFHDNKLGEERGKNTVYHINMDGLNIVHLGDLGHKLEEGKIQEIGATDILLVPVGGVYTINAKEAAEIVSDIEPKIIIPMHYSIPDLKFPLAELSAFLKEMGAENRAVEPKLSVSREKLPEEPQVVVLSKN